jgi:tRNA pseudouridine38-40 synthase
MTRYRATLAYDGTAYQGFQRQADGVPTIQGAVEHAIARVTSCEVSMIGAGRTDAGVHATGQVIAFEVVWKHGVDDLFRAINAVLPDDIALQDIAALAESSTFHPRFDAVSRLYRYDIIQSAVHQPTERLYAWRIRPPLDVEALQQAAAMLVGERDFGAFGNPPKGDNTVRRVTRSEWTTDNRRLHYFIEANAFLQHMVRRIVGHLVDVGRTTRTLDEFQAVIAGAQIVPNWTIAPPQGLFLVKVDYHPTIGA